jgi:hypothetical protein
MHFGGFFQAQYKVDGPCCHWLAPKVNGIFCDRGSNFRIRQCIFPWCILLILIFDPREFAGPYQQQSFVLAVDMDPVVDIGLR